MKTFKIILLVIWGIITICLLLYARQQKSYGEFYKRLVEKTVKGQKEYPEIVAEYYNNFMLIKNDTLNNINIDSLYENSIFLPEYHKAYNKVMEYENK